MRARKTLQWLLLGLGVTIGAWALALLLVFREFGTAQALIPLPIQPFDPAQQGGLSTTQLGAPTTTFGVGGVGRGERLGRGEVIGILLDPDDATRQAMVDIFGQDRLIACESKELPKKLAAMLRSIRGI
jgi:hypothetical protein